MNLRFMLLSLILVASILRAQPKQSSSAGRVVITSTKWDDEVKGDFARDIAIMSESNGQARLWLGPLPMLSTKASSKPDFLASMRFIMGTRLRYIGLAPISQLTKAEAADTTLRAAMNSGLVFKTVSPEALKSLVEKVTVIGSRERGAHTISVGAIYIVLSPGAIEYKGDIAAASVTVQWAWDGAEAVSKRLVPLTPLYSRSICSGDRLVSYISNILAKEKVDAALVTLEGFAKMAETELPAAFPAWEAISDEKHYEGLIEPNMLKSLGLDPAWKTLGDTLASDSRSLISLINGNQIGAEETARICGRFDSLAMSMIKQVPRIEHLVELGEKLPGNRGKAVHDSAVISLGVHKKLLDGLVSANSALSSISLYAPIRL